MRHLRAAFLALALSLTLSASFGALPAFAAVQAAPGTGDAGSSAPLPIHTEVPIPTSPVEQGVNTYTNGVVRDVADYIQVVYNFMISIVGMIAAVMMIIGGFQYLTSAGDAGKIGAARKRIADALIGMVLALGSYALLNTINPALLQFKPIGVELKAVSTVVSFLPWCEELRDPTDPSKTVSATPVGGQECGNVGEYKIGNATSYCVYRGSCGATPGPLKNGDKPIWSTCLQKPGLTSKDIKDMLDIKPGTKVPIEGYGSAGKVAECLACAQISKNVAKEMGYGELDGACTGWAQTRNQIFIDDYSGIHGQLPPDQINRTWSYCLAATEHNGCVQADVDCHAVNRNTNSYTPSYTGAASYVAGKVFDYSPVGLIYNAFSSASCGDKGTCGCEGYNDSPTPLFLDSKNPTLEEAKSPYIMSDITDGGTMDHFSVQLTELCSWNPCADYVDSDTKQLTFQKGCKGGDGFVSKVARFAVHQDFKITSCANN